MNWWRFAILAAFTAFVVESALADAPRNPVRVEMKIITLPQEDALSLLGSGEIVLSETTLKKLEALRKSGKAKLEVQLLANHLLGQEAAESNTREELRYPIGWSENMLGWRWGPMPPEPMKSRVLPWTVETRFIGFQFSAEPTEIRGSAITVDLEFSGTRLEHWTRAAAFNLESGLSISQPVPQFATQSIREKLTVPNGKWTLIGFVKETGDSPRIQIRLFRATTRSETLK